MPDTCPCGHSMAAHSTLAGCLAQVGNGYCTCEGARKTESPTLPPMPTPGGATFVQEIDGVRLNRQQQAVYTLMRDGRFRTLREIADQTGFPEASVSARLRDFRKRPLILDVQRRRRTEQGGTWEYAVMVEPEDNGLRHYHGCPTAIGEPLNCEWCRERARSMAGE